MKKRPLAGVFFNSRTAPAGAVQFMRSQNAIHDGEAVNSSGK